MRSTGVNLGPTRRRRGRGRGQGHEAEAAAPKSVYATPHKALHNPINRLRHDPNLDSTTYTITKIKT
jgi:ribosomal protein L19E